MGVRVSPAPLKEVKQQLISYCPPETVVTGSSPVLPTIYLNREVAQLARARI